MNKLYKNWAFHNLIAHPLMQLMWWVGLGPLGDRLHNATLPEEK